MDLCQRNLAFIWLTKGQKPQRDAFYDFKGKKLTGEILDELNYQFMRRLQKEGLITLKELYINGTKIEANANRYTFVWRGSINYHLAGLLDTIDALYAKYNAFVYGNGYFMRNWKNAAGALWNIRNVLRSWGKTVTAIPRRIWKQRL